MKTVPLSEATDYHLKAGSRAFDKRMKIGRGITYKKPMSHRKIKRKLERERRAKARRNAKKP